MKFPLSFYKLVMAAAVALPTMALATITPEAPQQDTDNCYMIGSAAELYGFAEMVNDGSGFNGCGKLTANIVVNENLLTESNVGDDGTFIGSKPAHIWIPMGTSETPFKGSFHGQGHTISGLYFNDPKKEKVGLFGSVGNVEIDGLGLVDSYFEGSSNVGGFVGYAGGTVYIRNSYNSSVVRGHSGNNDWWCGVGGFVGAAEVDKLEIENSYNLGFVTGGPAVGGLVGIIKVDENFSVSNSYNAGDVKGTAEAVGGLVGYVGYLFSDDVDVGIVSSYNTGSVVCGGVEGVGGLVGYLDDEFEIRIVNSYNTGTVDGNNAGGLTGTDGEGFAYVYNSYNAGLVNDGNGDALGLSYDVDNFYYLEGSSVGFYTSKSAADFADGTVAKLLHDWCEKDGDVCKEGGLDGSVWGQGLGRDALPTLTGAIGPALTLHVYEGVEIDSAYTPDTDLPTPTREGFAFLGWFTDAGFSGSAVTNIPSDATGALEYFAKWEAQGGSGCIEIANADDLYDFAARVNGGEGEICGELTADICVNACGEGKSVLNADGTLNGSSFTQWTPMNVSDGVTVTLDGNGHTISGLYFNNEKTDNVGLFGEVLGAVSISDLGVVDFYVKGKSEVGSLAGQVSKGKLNIKNSFSAGSVEGKTYVGGFVGLNKDNGEVKIENCYNESSVNAFPGIVGGLVGDNNGGTLNVSNCYNVGVVTASNGIVGGLVGYNNDGTLNVLNCYNVGAVRGIQSIGGLVGANVKGTMSVSNSFFIGTNGDGDKLGGEAKTPNEFADGTVALLLHNWCEKDGDNCKVGGLDGSIWGQDLSKENSRPEFIERLDYKQGSVTFFEKAGKIDSAYVDATSDLAVDFPNDVVVSGPIKFKRTFAGSGYSTIVLPFQPNCSGDDCVENSANVKFYEFGSYANATVSVTEVSPSALQANTPYLVQAAGAAELVFDKGGTFNTTEGGVFNSETGEYKKVLDDVDGNVNGWTIYGTYAYKQWNAGDAGLGKTYGFAGAADNDPAIVGQFAKIGVGAYIYPMRAYLEYVAPAPAGRPAANGAVRAFAANTVASLPDEIDVVIVEKGETGTEIAGSDDASGEQTTRVIGTINTRTGEFKFANDRWFDLNGRYLGNKKPTQKGAYYNNGKKVIVK